MEGQDDWDECFLELIQSDATNYMTKESSAAELCSSPLMSL